MAFTEQIAATTAYATKTFSVAVNTTITADDLTGDEEVIVEVIKVDGVNYKELWSQGRRIFLTSSNNTDVIIGPADYKVIKNITVNAVAIGTQS